MVKAKVEKDEEALGRLNNTTLEERRETRSEVKQLRNLK